MKQWLRKVSKIALFPVAALALMLGGMASNLCVFLIFGNEVPILQSMRDKQQEPDATHSV